VDILNQILYYKTQDVGKLSLLLKNKTLSLYFIEVLDKEFVFAVFNL
jgi:hypothetical protein